MSFSSDKPSTTLLRLNQVSLKFPEEPMETLQQISLEIREGDFLGIVGPSGCGKSTLLRILAGLLPATTGTREVTDPGQAELAIDRPGGIAMVFQEPRLLPWRTVLGNMHVPFELTNQHVDRERIEDLLRKTGLQPGDLQKYPRMLSGGMKMRVAVARALALRPRLILLDEPFAAVDDLLREQLNEELLALQQTFGFAAVLVTHHLSEAVYLSKQLLVMSSRPGVVKQAFSLDWPATRPAHLRDSDQFNERQRQIRRVLFSNPDNPSPSAD